MLITSRRLNMSKICALLSITLVSTVLVGCGGAPEGPALYSVTGPVTFDGAPVDTGRIQFRMKQGSGLSYSAEIKGGQYSLQSEAGAVSVEITASRPIPGKFDTSNPDDEPQPVGEMYIPEKYNAKTELSAEVAATGENKIPFELTSK